MSVIRQNTCSTCSFKVREGADLYCRFNPPVSHPVIGMGRRGPEVTGVVTVFPKVEGDWWCGRWAQSAFNTPAMIGDRPIGNA